MMMHGLANPKVIYNIEGKIVPDYVTKRQIETSVYVQ